MTVSFQDLLFYIPLHQLTFIIPLPKKPLYYDTVDFSLTKEHFSEPTLVLLRKKEEIMQLNDSKTANQIIQDPNLIGIVSSTHELPSMNKEILTMFHQCGIPFIHVNDPQILKIFQKDTLFSYGQVSMELNGFMETGFVNLASQLAFALETPILYLDENNELLWQTGQQEELREATRWINAHQKELELGESIIYSSKKEDTEKNSFDIYSINIG